MRVGGLAIDFPVEIGSPEVLRVIDRVAHATADNDGMATVALAFVRGVVMLCRVPRRDEWWREMGAFARVWTMGVDPGQGGSNRRLPQDLIEYLTKWRAREVAWQRARGSAPYAWISP